MSKQDHIYLDVKFSNLQAFFAVLAFAEENFKNSIFLFDELNKALLEECLRFIKLRMISKSEFSGNFKIVEIVVDHATPITRISGIFSAPIIFPKVISNKYHKPLNRKIDKIYFRGLFTRQRILETLLILFKNRDIYGFLILAKHLIKGTKNFRLVTKKVYFDFTTRGRQSQFKYLDEDYYRELSEYKFAFCPRGDFEWTYRFFEAVQVGSIPLSKVNIEAYSDFFYLKSFEGSKINLDKDALQNLLVFKTKFHFNQ